MENTNLDVYGLQKNNKVARFLPVKTVYSGYNVIIN